MERSREGEAPDDLTGRLRDLKRFLQREGGNASSQAISAGLGLQPDELRSLLELASEKGLVRVTDDEHQTVHRLSTTPGEEP